MIEISVRELKTICDVEIIAGDEETQCKGVVIDSRLVDANSIFVAFPGENVDGNNYTIAACDRGAGCVCMTRKPTVEELKHASASHTTLMLTSDPEKFLQDLAIYYRDKINPIVVGITGSVGKTSTKEMTRDLLATKYRVHATSGNFNNLLGLPLTILSAPADTEVLVLEMGMSALGEISTLSRIGRPNLSIITKVGTSHVGMLGSRENIARAKAEIIEGMAPSAEKDHNLSSKLFMTAGDDFTQFIIDTFAAPAGVDVELCGARVDGDITAHNIELDEASYPSFGVKLQDGSEFETVLSLTGIHSVSNALLAIGVAHELGVANDVIADTLAHMKPAHMRQEQRTSTSGACIIDDSYNAAPDSIAAALDVLMKLNCDGMHAAVLGQVGELGDEAQLLHGLIGAYAAAKKLDLLVCVGGKDAQQMAASAKLMGMPDDTVMVVDTAQDALEALSEVFGENDIVLVKGSRSVGLDKFVEGMCA